jgi:PPK2 family polyphosphate:nucleotide phosphotransferase
MTLEIEHSEKSAASAGVFPPVDAARYRVKPGAVVHLSKMDTRATDGFDGDKKAGKELLSILTKRIGELQEIFYAENRHRLLVVLQAMDTGGKDGTISHVFDNVNPQGVDVASFKAPTPKELAHDFLWRIHPHVPGNGEIVVFNRSHYEDVLVVRVHKQISNAVCRQRFEHINAFEKMLVEEGTTILKFYLHISKDEQKDRLQARIDNPAKNWKFDPGDLAERKRWDGYIAAADDMLNHTSTEEAPWFVVPADRKWYRNLIVAQAIIDSLECLKLAYPEPKQPLDGIVVE